ncbi:MAG TPA: heme-degrading domain-containing protein, partial [Rectinemataceae bacterium]
MDDILKDLLKQEAELRFPAFDETQAMKLGMLIMEKAIADGLPIAIDISRGERQLFHVSLPGASADNDQWIQRKRRTVNRFGHSSFYIGNLLKSQGKTLGEKYFISDQEYSAHGGAFPIIVEGTGQVGVVAVSGLPQEEDHRLLVECLGK